MKKSNPSISYSYRQLRLTKDDIKEICSIIGNNNMESIEADDYTLDSIDEIDDIKDAFLTSLTLCAYFSSDESDGYSGVDELILKLSRSTATLSLDNTDNIIAFAILRKIDDVLKDKRTSIGRYGTFIVATIMLFPVFMTLVYKNKDTALEIKFTLMTLIILILFLLVKTSKYSFFRKAIIHLSPKKPHPASQWLIRFATKAIDNILDTSIKVVVGFILGSLLFPNIQSYFSRNESKTIQQPITKQQAPVNSDYSPTTDS